MIDEYSIGLFVIHIISLNIHGNLISYTNSINVQLLFLFRLLTF